MPAWKAHIYGNNYYQSVMYLWQESITFSNVNMAKIKIAISFGYWENQNVYVHWEDESLIYILGYKVFYINKPLSYRKIIRVTFICFLQNFHVYTSNYQLPD